MCEEKLPALTFEHSEVNYTTNEGEQRAVHPGIRKKDQKFFKNVAFLSYIFTMAFAWKAKLWSSGHPDSTPND